jgi:hypothetical protein
MRTRSRIGNMVFGGFPKKIRNKTFYFHGKFFFHFNLVLLSFGTRVHFRSQTWTFWSNTPEYKFQSKTVKLSYFTLEKSIFFFFNQFFFHSYQSCPMLRGVDDFITTEIPRVNQSRQYQTSFASNPSK